MKYNHDDIAALAAAVYGEARSEPRVGQDAVAHNILNRARIADAEIADVVYGSLHPKYGQYSFANPGSHQKTISNAPRIDPKGWDAAIQVALDAVEGRSQDPSDGATHYFNPKIASNEAKTWSKSLISKGDIGNHSFFKDTDAGTKSVVRRAARSQHRRKPLVDANSVAYAAGVPIPSARGTSQEPKRLYRATRADLEPNDPRDIIVDFLIQQKSPYWPHPGTPNQAGSHGRKPMTKEMRTRMRGKFPMDRSFIDEALEASKSP